MASEKDSPTIFLHKQGNALVPWAQADADLIERYTTGAKLRTKVWETRSNKQNRFYWAVLNLVVKAVGTWPNSLVLHEALKLHFGVVQVLPRIDGAGVHVLPGSTSFQAMSGEAFKEYLQMVTLFVTTDLIPGMTVDELFAEANATLGPEERYDPLRP